MKDIAINLPPTAVISEVIVVAVPGFSMLALGAILEPLFFVAQNYPDQLSDVRFVGGDQSHLVSASGVGVTSSETLSECSVRIERGARPGAVFICSGQHVDQGCRKELLRLLRACNRQNTSVFTMGGVTALLAGCGILRGGSATIHWRSLAALAESHPDMSIKEALFLTCGNHTSCAGETAALDMTLDFIRENMPSEIARAVCAQLVISMPRPGSDRQPGSAMAVAERLPSPVKTVIELMCEHLELPVKMAALCRVTNVSQRHIERMFRAHLGTSPRQYYLLMRLERARQFVEHTNLPLREVAMASGFHSVSGFSKRYRTRFGVTPAAARQDAVTGALVM